MSTAPRPSPRPNAGRPPWLAIALSVAVALAIAVFAVPPLLVPLLAARIRARAAERGIVASWDRLAVDWPLRVRLSRLALRRVTEATAFATVDHARAELAPRLGTPRVTFLELGA